jgi:hypothetical protein
MTRKAMPTSKGDTWRTGRVPERTTDTYYGPCQPPDNQVEALPLSPIGSILLQQV